MTGPQQSPYDFDRLARRLGQNDPAAWRWKPRANDNKPTVKPATRADLFVAFALGAVIGAATLYILFFN
jgi:endo-1,4-beta-D-glucanase Y